MSRLWTKQPTHVSSCDPHIVRETVIIITDDETEDQEGFNNLCEVKQMESEKVTCLSFCPNGDVHLSTLQNDKKLQPVYVSETRGLTKNVIVYLPNTWPKKVILQQNLNNIRK